MLNAIYLVFPVKNDTDLIYLLHFSAFVALLDSVLMNNMEFYVRTRTSELK